MEMNGKSFTTSSLAVAIATTLVVSGALTPAQGYAKPSTDAIIGTGKGKHANDAIIGTGRSKMVASDAIIGTGKGRHANDAIIGTGKTQVLILGAIDRVDAATGTISVLGRRLKLPTVANVKETLAGGRQLMVAVSGRISDSGTVENMKLRFMPADYVAGSSKVVVSGRVTDLDTGVGTMKVGGIAVDISSSQATRMPAAGSFIVLVGTQPVREGVVLAEQLFVR